MGIRIFFLLFFVLPELVQANTAPWVGTSLNEIQCDGGGQGFGPFDYTRRNSLPHEISLVEGAHFTPDVENLIKGKTSATPEGDLNYTLRAWPNHHRALLSIIKYQLKINSKLQLKWDRSVDKLTTPPECYLQRAIHFSPKDAVSYSLYGYYLKKVGHLEDAIKYYEKALEIAPENAKFAYSFSLLLIDLKRYEDAVKYAKIAYHKGKTPDKLKQKLKKLGVWNE